MGMHDKKKYNLIEWACTTQNVQINKMYVHNTKITSNRYGILLMTFLATIVNIVQFYW